MKENTENENPQSGKTLFCANCGEEVIPEGPPGNPCNCPLCGTYLLGEPQ